MAAACPVFKIMMIGDAGVGKTSLLLRYVDDTFSTDLESTIGVDFKLKNYTNGGKSAQLQVWDTAGQEAQSKTLNTFTSSCFRGAHAMVLVYDISDEASFSDVHSWLLEVNKYGKEECFKILIGNKTDLEAERVVSTEQAENYATDLGIPFFETSAATGDNVESAFAAIAEELISRVKKEAVSKSEDNIVHLNSPRSRKSSLTSSSSGGCCK